MWVKWASLQLPAEPTLANADIWCCRLQLGQSRIIKWRTQLRADQSSPFLATYLTSSSVTQNFLSWMDENKGDPCQDILSFPFVSPRLKTLQRRKIVSISVNVMTHGGWARPVELEPHPATCLSGGQTTNRGCQGLYTFLLFKLQHCFKFQPCFISNSWCWRQTVWLRWGWLWSGQGLSQTPFNPCLVAVAWTPNLL